MLGGADVPIQVLSRDQGSGTYDAFVSRVLGGQRLRTDARLLEDNAALVGAVAADEGAIGFVGLPFIGPTRAPARQFVELALSDEGRKIVEAEGVVFLSIAAEKPPVPVRAPARYRTQTGGASRLSVDFRFRTGSTALDARGVQDLEKAGAVPRDARPPQRADQPSGVRRQPGQREDQRRALGQAGAGSRQ